MRLRPLILASALTPALAGPLVAFLLAQAGWSVTVSVLVAAAAAVCAGLGLAVPLGARYAQRIAEVTDAVGRYAAGDLGGRLRHLRDDELTPLATAIDGAFRAVDARGTALVRDRARTEAVLAGMVEGVIAVDEVGRVQLVNDAACAMLRLTHEVVGRRYLEVLRHPAVVAQVGRALHGETPAGIELSPRSDGSQALVSRAAPVTADGRGGAVLVLHDITDLRRADRVRRDFVANVSHELRTPLTAIRGYVEALLDGPAGADETPRFLEVIARHASRMERLVKDLLRLARLDAGQEIIERVPCLVDTLFGAVVSDLEPVTETRGQVVEIEIAPDAREVEGDPAKLHDIFRNLVENASNYSPEGSEITLRAVWRPPWVELSVADEGPGVPEADLARIFERFYRVDRARSRETGGTGLGLSIVKHLVELHLGRVRAENRPEGGAVFTVSLRPPSRRPPGDASSTPGGRA